MATLTIFLFGRVRIARDDTPEVTDPTRTVAALLAFLILNRQPHRREALLAALWPTLPEERARRCLNTTLWRLRKLVEPNGTPRGKYLLTTPTGEIGLHPDGDCWLDVVTFEQRLGDLLAKPAPALTDADVRTWHDALGLYTGPLLDGYDDAWARAERDRLAHLHLTGLAGLVHAHRLRQEYQPALALGGQALQLDPLREDVHREVMRVHLSTGQRAMAVRQYEVCREACRTELGTRPAAATDALYHQAINAAPPAVSPGAPAAVSPGAPPAVVPAVAAEPDSPAAPGPPAGDVRIRIADSLVRASQALLEAERQLGEGIALLHAITVAPAPVSPGSAPVSPGPAPASGAQASVSPGPAPVSPGPAPLWPGPAPLSPSPAPLSPSSAPASRGPAAVAPRPVVLPTAGPFALLTDAAPERGDPGESAG